LIVPLFHVDRHSLVCCCFRSFSRQERGRKAPRAEDPQRVRHVPSGALDNDGFVFLVFLVCLCPALSYFFLLSLQTLFLRKVVQRPSKFGMTLGITFLRMSSCVQLYVLLFLFGWIFVSVIF
jgi:hypothetical protein